MSTAIQPTGPLNKTLLGHAVAAQLGITENEGHAVVAAVLNTIARTIASGHAVTVTNFGSFTPFMRPARQARDPRTGGAVFLPERQELRVRVSPQLLAAVRAGDPDAAVIAKRSRS